MSKELNEKLQSALLRTALSQSKFRMIHWASRVQELQTLLAKKGIDVHLYYNYTLPHEMTHHGVERVSDKDAHQNFMERIAILGLCAGFTDKKKIQWVSQDKLNFLDKLKLGGHVLSEKENAVNEINRCFDDVLEKNPDLNVVARGTETVLDKYNVLCRVMEGYSPTDIAFFEKRRKQQLNVIDEKRMQTSKEKLKKALADHKIENHEYDLSLATMDMLLEKLVPNTGNAQGVRAQRNTRYEI